MCNNDIDVCTMKIHSSMLHETLREATNIRSKFKLRCNLLPVYGRKDMI